MTHHRHVSLREQTGFTLIEMIITIVIISIVASIGVTTISSGFKAYFTASSISPLANNARLVLERLRKEIRNAQSCADVSQPAGVGSLQFTNDEGRVILVNQGVRPTNAIYMTFNGDGNEWLLAPNVEQGSLRFERTDCTGVTSPGIVTISFTMSVNMMDGENIKLPFRTSVYIRSTSS